MRESLMMTVNGAKQLKKKFFLIIFGSVKGLVKDVFDTKQKKPEFLFSTAKGYQPRK